MALCVLRRLLGELLVSLQWGEAQTSCPGAQPRSTAELALINHKLAKAIHAHLLGNVSTSGQKKILSADEFCSTPAEKMAETVRCFCDALERLLLSCSPGKCLALGGGTYGIATRSYANELVTWEKIVSSSEL